MRHSFFIIVWVMIWATKLACAIELSTIDEEKLKVLLSSGAKVEVVFVFTSWCSVCKRSFSELLDLYKEYQDDDVKFIIISLDKDIDKLTTFTNRFTSSATVYYFERDYMPTSVANALYHNHIGYKGRIPHLTLFNYDQVIADDNYDIASVSAAINHLLNN